MKGGGENEEERERRKKQFERTEANNPLNVSSLDS